MKTLVRYRRLEKIMPLSILIGWKWPSAFNIEVEQGNAFSVSVKGDRRNIDDLNVYKNGSTLVVEFDDNGNRHHDTYVSDNYAHLKGVNFSGASVSKITWF